MPQTSKPYKYMKNAEAHEECHLKILGGFPPPITGNSASLLAITNEVEKKANVRVKKLDVSTAQLNRNAFVVLLKLWRYIQHWMVLLASFSKARKSLYMICEGDKALVFTLLTILVGRLSGHAITLHHHSFSYINSHRFLMRAVNYTLGKKNQHVFLSAGMAEKFFQTYPCKRGFVVNHNLGQLEHFLDTSTASPLQARSPDEPLVVGMLSNLMNAKGLDTYIKIAIMAREANLPIRFELAGPPVSDQDAAQIEYAVEKLADQFRYLGPLYGQEKALFLKRLDVFIFPTRYHHEAQPIVLLEALCSGAAVISNDRGCIAEDMAQMGGISIDKNHASNPDAYLEVLEKFARDREGLDRFRARAAALTQKRVEQTAIEKSNLINRICLMTHEEQFNV